MSNFLKFIVVTAVNIWSLVQNITVPTHYILTMQENL